MIDIGLSTSSVFPLKTEDAFRLARLGSLADGQVFDEHLLPGRGTQPVAQVLAKLAAGGWSGSVVAEINTRKTRSEHDRLELLLETLEFARAHTAPNVSSAPEQKRTTVPHVFAQPERTTTAG